MLSSSTADAFDCLDECLESRMNTTSPGITLRNECDGTGNTTYKYDIQGRLIQKTQTTGTVVKTIGYGYDALGRMSSITYPSGKVLTYTFDVQGRVASMAVNAVNLVSGITYQPFGPAKSWTWSGGPVQTRNFDLDGRQTSYPYTATGTVNLTYDLGNRITSLSGSRTKSYAYDKLDRLITENTTLTYTYDANGNRSQYKNGTAISTYNNPTTSNKLTSITGTGPEAYTYDLAGNTTAIAAKTLAYDARKRLITHTGGTTVTTFGINAIGQRLVKAGATAALTTRFVYGEDGKLLGEYDNAGALITEHVYLADTPIAAIKSTGAFVVQADHLNTPRAILGAGNVSAWTWDSDAFGTTLANEKPSTLATFNYNLRFPGQYYDKETLTHYNYFRDYYPKTGKYIESDPIGLKGGINTYAYVDSNPINKVDPRGLDNPRQGPYNYNPPGTTPRCSLGCMSSRQAACSFAYSLCRGGGAFDPTPPNRGDTRRDNDGGLQCLREFEECSKPFNDCRMDCECKNADRSR
jgi:RHS repeat-associated protein